MTPQIRYSAALPQLTDLLRLVTTYGKDSIWNVDGKPFKAVTVVAAFDSERRAVTLNDMAYRFVEAKLTEVMKLLEKPNGTIPIHRTHAPIEGAKSLVAGLLLRLKRQTNP